jgi:hypothetical protein
MSLEKNGSHVGGCGGDDVGGGDERCIRSDSRDVSSPSKVRDLPLALSSLELCGGVANQSACTRRRGGIQSST